MLHNSRNERFIFDNRQGGNTLKTFGKIQFFLFCTHDSLLNFLSFLGILNAFRMFHSFRNKYDLGSNA